MDGGLNVWGSKTTAGEPTILKAKQKKQKRDGKQSKRVAGLRGCGWSAMEKNKQCVNDTNCEQWLITDSTPGRRRRRYSQGLLWVRPSKVIESWRPAPANAFIQFIDIDWLNWNIRDFCAQAQSGPQLPSSTSLERMRPSFFHSSIWVLIGRILSKIWLSIQHIYYARNASVFAGVFVFSLLLVELNCACWICEWVALRE